MKAMPVKITINFFMKDLICLYKRVSQGTFEENMEGKETQQSIQV